MGPSGRLVVIKGQGGRVMSTLFEGDCTRPPSPYSLILLLLLLGISLIKTSVPLFLQMDKGRDDERMEEEVSREEEELLLEDEDEGVDGVFLTPPPPPPSEMNQGEQPLSKEVPSKEGQPRKNLSGAQKRKRAKANRVAAAAAKEGPKEGCPQEPTSGTSTGGVTTPNRSAAPLITSPKGETKAGTYSRNVAPVMGGDTGQSLEAPKSGKRDRGSPDSGNPRPRKRIPMTRDLPKGALKVHFGYKDQGKGRVSATDYAGTMAEIRKAIDDLKGSLVVKLGGVKAKGCGFEAECHDEATRLWMEGLVEQLMGGIFRVRTGEEARVPTRTVGVWVREPTPPSPGIFFPAISRHNGGMDTSRWRIRCAMPSRGGHFLLIAMDEESFRRIQPPAHIYYYTDLLDFTFEPPPPRGREQEGKGK